MSLQDEYLIFLIIGNRFEELDVLFKREKECNSRLFTNKLKSIEMKKYILSLEKWFRKPGFKEFLEKNLDEIIEAKPDCKNLECDEFKCYEGNKKVPSSNGSRSITD